MKPFFKGKNILALLIVTVSILLVLYYIEVITVSDKIQSCEGENKHSPQCWQDMVERTFKKAGLAAAYDLFVELYNAEPNFAKYCHDISHSLGKAAYDVYAQRKEFTLDAKASYCSFGFYHGLTEALVGTDGDVGKARDFCAYVDEQLSSKRPGSKFACYHGVGHGWASYHEDNPEEWNIVNSSLPFCEEFAETRDQLLLCSTGVFDTIAILYYNPAAGLKINKEDPLWLCRAQEKEIYKEACYREMVTAILWLADYDVSKAIDIVEKSVEDKYMAISVRDAVDASIRFVIQTPKIFDTISVCHSLREPLRLACVEGFASGVMQFGAPEKEYGKALEFCKNPVFSADEQSACFGVVFNSSQSLYSKGKVQDICRTVQEQYRPEICES